MIWKEIYNKESTDNKTQRIRLELWLDFPKSVWNDNTSSPVLMVDWYDNKSLYSYPLCHAKVCAEYPKKDCTNCKIYTQGMYRKIEVKFYGAQRMPDISIYSGQKGGSNYEPEKDKYDTFTLEFAKELAINKYKEYINNILKQI